MHASILPCTSPQSTTLRGASESFDGRPFYSDCSSRRRQRRSRQRMQLWTVRECCHRQLHLRSMAAAAAAAVEVVAVAAALAAVTSALEQIPLYRMYRRRQLRSLSKAVAVTDSRARVDGLGPTPSSQFRRITMAESSSTGPPREGRTTPQMATTMASIAALEIGTLQ